MSGKQIPLENRFWTKVDKDGPVPERFPELGKCWIWTAAKNEFGYGMIGAPHRSQRRAIKATHAVWLLTHGCLPDQSVLHHCDNPSCVNPDHLFLGSQRDNMRDCAAKGRIQNVGWSRKTQCIRGHDLVPINTRIYKGRRYCRTCNAMRCTIYRNRRKERRILGGGESCR